MLITYSKLTGEVLSVSGYRLLNWDRGTIPQDAVDSLEPVEPLSEDQGYFRIYDQGQMKSVWQWRDEEQDLEVVFDGQGEPVGVQPV